MHGARHQQSDLLQNMGRIIQNEVTRTETAHGGK